MAISNGTFLKKGNFPLLSIIKPIFLSLPGYSLDEVKSVSSTPLRISCVACPNRNLSKQLAGLDKMKYSPKAGKGVPYSLVYQLQPKWRAVSGQRISSRW